MNMGYGYLDLPSLGVLTTGYVSRTGLGLGRGNAGVGSVPGAVHEHRFKSMAELVAFRFLCSFEQYSVA